MKRTNIHLHEGQRAAMVCVAKMKGTKPAVEYRKAIDNHISAHLPTKPKKSTR